MSTMIDDWDFYERLLGSVLSEREVAPVELFFAPPWEPEHAADLLIPIFPRRDIVPSVKVGPVVDGLHLRLKLPVTNFRIPEQFLRSVGWSSEGGEQLTLDDLPFVVYSQTITDGDGAASAICRTVRELAKAPLPLVFFPVGDRAVPLREFLVWAIARDEGSAGAEDDAYYRDYGSPVHH